MADRPTAPWSGPATNGYAVHVQRRRGIRFAYLEVLPLIEGEVVVSISPDGNCDPAVLPALIDKMREGTTW